MENLAFELAYELAVILNTVQAHGEFYATGTAEAAAPILEVEGEGRIALPLLADQAARLIALAEAAPFGRGEQTVIDPAVRRTWQIAPDRVRLSGRGWPAMLDTIINRAAADLGVTTPIAAERYKLLIYEEGSFFVPHRDTEKQEGMFATLVLVLPSLCQGGQLLIRHSEQEVCLDLNRDEPGDVAFAAFYADCVHEVRPVTSGYRLTLVYNLLRYGDGPMPSLADHSDQAATLAALLQRWGQAGAGEATGEALPTKLIYPLEHAYTPAELDFANLKLADAATAATLLQAAQQADCEVYLTLLSIEESGSAEYPVSRHRRGRGRGYWHDNDDDDDMGNEVDFEIGEIIDSSFTLSHWRRADGAPCSITTLPFTSDEICPPDLFDDMEPDEQHFYGATGNEGASFERSYQRAALVLWPRARGLAVHNQGGLCATLPLLEDAVQRKQQGEQGVQVEQGEQGQGVHLLVSLMLGTWRDSHNYPSSNHAEHATRFLACLMQLQDQAHLAAFVNDITASGIYHGDENAALTKALTLLGPALALAALEKIIINTARRNPLACTNLLLRVSHEPTLCRNAIAWHPAAQCLLALLLVNEPGSVANGWLHPVVFEANLLADLLDALAQIQAEKLGKQLLDYVLANPQRCDMDRVLLPASLNLVGRACRADPGVERLRAACQAHLQKRIAQPLAAPTDFCRPAQLSCNCADCAELAKFLADPTRGKWVFAAPEQRRGHVEASVRRDKCDLDLSTLKQGRPYSLVATKNQASYQQRVAQRKTDLADLAQLVTIYPATRAAQ